MSDLKGLQRLFHAAVVSDDRDFIAQIKTGGRITPEKRLSIYAYAYKARLRGVLREDFPVLHAMLGDEAFDVLSNAYIDHYPSHHPSLRFFGQHMAKFTARTAPYENNPVIEEMARFEWSFRDVFDAADRASVGVEDVAAIPPMAWTILRLNFHPSVRLHSFRWNVAAVWSSVKEDAEHPVAPERLEEKTIVVQWRDGLLSYYRSLERDEAQVLTMAMAQKSFPDLCESLAEYQAGNAAVRAAELLKTWVLAGMVTKLDHADIT